MKIINRGDPTLWNSIRDGARKVSEANGIRKISENHSDIVIPTPSNVPSFSSTVDLGGAYQSIQKKSINPLVGNSVSVEKPYGKVQSNNTSYDFHRSMIDRCLDAIEGVQYTKEYGNAVMALFQLYVTDNLSVHTINRLQKEDKEEILAILRDFKMTLEME